MYKSETPVQDAVFGTKPFINWKLFLCVFLTTFVSSTFIDGFIGSTIIYTLAGFGLYLWLLILYQLFRMIKNSKKKPEPKTHGSVIVGMTDEERDTLYFMVGQAIRDTREKEVGKK